MSDEEKGLVTLALLIGLFAGYKIGYRSGKNDILSAFDSAQRYRH